MNRRGRSPLIWPPNRNETSNVTSEASSARPCPTFVQLTDGAADALRRLEHGRGVQQRFGLAGLRVFQALAQRC